MSEEETPPFDECGAGGKTGSPREKTTEESVVDASLSGACKTNVDFALRYAQNGFAVLPVFEITPKGKCACGQSKCQHPGKHPRVDGGWKAATNGQDQIKGWWTQWPLASIGMVPQGFSVIDVDPQNNGDSSPFDERRHARSGGGGRHFLFRPEPDFHNAKPLTGVDFKPADKEAPGYFLVEPSRHRSGGTYRWLDPKNPLTCKLEHLYNGLAYLPQWLKDAAAASEAAALAEGKSFRKAREKSVKQGGRDEYIFRAASSFYIKSEKEPTYETLYKKLADENLRACDPPFTDRLIQYKVRRAMSNEKLKGWRQEWIDRNKFTIKDDGLYEGDDRVCSRLEIVALGNEGDVLGYRLVRFTDENGNVREVALAPEQLLGDRAGFVEALYKQGLSIEVGRETSLLQFLRNTPVDGRFRVTKRIGWHDRNTFFVMPDETFGEVPEQRVRFSGLSKHAFNVEGTLQQWQENVAKPCIGNSRLVFCAACGFAGPMLSLLGAFGAGFHLHGMSTTGKSTGVKVAGSIWGGGQLKKTDGFLHSWDGTDNGITGSAEGHNDCLLALDEIGRGDGKKIGKLIYALIDGMGRTRMRPDITLREPPSWTLVLLSSGEKTLQQMMADAGQTMMAGQELRVAVVPSDAGAGVGMFEECHGMAPEVFARTVSDAACAYYGTAGRGWLRLLVAQRETFIDRAKATMEAFEKQYVPEGVDATVRRAARNFAIVAAAGELASPITLWDPAEAFRSAGKCFAAWLGARAAGMGQSDDAAYLSKARLFVSLHGMSRFENAVPGADPRSIQQRAGIIRNGDFWILDEVYQQEIFKGCDYKSATKALQRAGYMDDTKGGNAAKNAPSREERKLNRKYYVISGSILGEDEPPSDARPPENEESPF